MSRRQYHRQLIGYGNAFKAVTRTRRAAPSHQIGKLPGWDKARPANWRVHRRRAMQTVSAAVEAAQEREAGSGSGQLAG